MCCISTNIILSLLGYSLYDQLGKFYTNNVLLFSVFFPVFFSKAEVNIDTFPEKNSIHSFIGKFLHLFLCSANNCLGVSAV